MPEHLTNPVELVMTEDQWVRRYAARMVARGSCLSFDQALARAEGGARATLETGNVDPGDWEAPETVADEDIDSEHGAGECSDPDLLTSFTLDGLAWRVVNGYGQVQAGPMGSLAEALAFISQAGGGAASV